MTESFDVAELFEVCAGTEDMCSVDDLVGVEMVVAAQDEIDQAGRGFACKFDVAGFTGMGKSDNYVCALGVEWRNKSFCGFRGGFVDQIGG